MSGGGGIRTHGTLARPTAFKISESRSASRSGGLRRSGSPVCLMSKPSSPEHDRGGAGRHQSMRCQVASSPTSGAVCVIARVRPPSSPRASLCRPSSPSRARADIFLHIERLHEGDSTEDCADLQTFPDSGMEESRSWISSARRPMPGSSSIACSAPGSISRSMCSASAAQSRPGSSV